MSIKVTVKDEKGACHFLDRVRGHVFKGFGVDTGQHVTEMPRRLVLEFEDSPDPGQLLTIEEQREVLSCYRERAMNGHQNAYDLLHITLSERFCPQVDGANQP